MGIGRALRSTSLRLALGFSLFFAGSALVLVGFIYWATAGYMDRQIDSTIRADVDGLADQYVRFGLAGLVASIQSRLATATDRGAIYVVADPSLHPVAGNLGTWPAPAGKNPGWFEVPIEINGRQSIARLHHYLLPGGFHLLVGRDVEDRLRVQSLIVDALLWSVLFTMVLAVGVGFGFRRVLMRRIDSFGRTASGIVAGDLAQRVGLSGTGDEFDQLAETINQMLDRIERLMEGVRQVSNAIAHDLRTPLARVRGRLERMADELDPSTAGREAVEAAIAELDELMNTFNALLRIAEIDAGAQRQAFAAFDLSAALTDLAELFEAVAEDRGLTFVATIAPGLTLEGDRHLLAQAIANLLDNAIKYTPGGGRVTLDAVVDGPQVVIAVADDGPGIPADEIGRVRERFYRVERSRGTPGSGLGLALVDAVARLHDGMLTLDGQRPGLRAALHLPLGHGLLAAALPKE